MRSDVATCLLSGKICSGFKVLNDIPTVEFEIQTTTEINNKPQVSCYTILAISSAAKQLAPLKLVKGSTILIEAGEMFQNENKTYIVVSRKSQIKSFNKEDFLDEGEINIDELI